MIYGRYRKEEMKALKKMLEGDNNKLCEEFIKGRIKELKENLAEETT